MIFGGAGSDLIYGGAGNDTISGGADDDLIYGGMGNDSIDAGEGLNEVHGEDGDDVIVAGAGPDQLYGGAGNDRINGGDGLNFVFGEAGNDVLIGGAGSDIQYGGDGDDQLNGGEGSNELNGDAGDDLLISGSGPDSIHGGIGNDTAYAGAGNDTIFGDDGNDVLDAGIGSDRVDGGNGNDLLSVGALRGPAQDPDRLDHLFGGAGFDTITADFSNQTIAMVVTAGQTQSLVFADGAEARDFENVHDFFTGSGDDVLTLDTAADDGFANLLKTGAGNDIIRSGAGQDIVDSGDGDDIVYAGANSDTVDAGAGDDFVNGGANDVVLTFSGGANGVPFTIGFTGPGETLAGGAGIDTLSFEGFSKPANFNALLGVSINLATNATNSAARGITISGFENVIGTEYFDELVGDAGPNVFNPLHGGGFSADGRGGPDTIDGAGGIDTVIIDFSREDLPTSTGVSSTGSSTHASYSRLTAGSVFNSQDAVNIDNVEQFHITGASKNDQLTGGSIGYDDILNGLGGNDTLGGNGGSDTLLGGEGNDVLTGQGTGVGSINPYPGAAGGHDVFDGGSGDDLVEDIGLDSSQTSFALSAGSLFQLDGGSGFDRLSADFSNQTAAIVWTSATPTAVNFSDGAYFRNFEQLRFFASGSGNDSIAQLGRVDNLFNLGAGDDVLNPGLGFDTVFGGAGNDLLVLDYRDGDGPTALGVDSSFDGFEGSYSRRDPVSNNRIDYITFREVERLNVTGSSHNDTLIGLAGDDTLIGGGGDDILRGQGGNNYLDGGDGNDTLTVGSGNNTMIGGAGNDFITGSDGNELMYGDDGNDTLIAHKGSDTIYGGAGDDLITASDFTDGLGYGVDTFDAGDGDDVVVAGYFNGTGNSYANATTRLKLDGGAGFDKLSADFGKQTEGIVFIGGTTNSHDFADGSYFRNFELLGDFVSGSGDDTLIVTGRFNKNLYGGEGNDTINPGLGIVFADGGAGTDLIIVDYSLGDGPNVSGVMNEGASVVRRDLITGAIIDSLLSTSFERVDATGGSKADVLAGGNLADVFHGNAGNDIIDGNGGDDYLDGGPGADLLRGGTGNDTYIVDDPGDVVTEGAGAGYDTVIYTGGGSFTQPANIEKIIFLRSTTLPSLDIGPGGVVILGAASAAPAPPASVPVDAMLAVDSGLNVIARLQAHAGTLPVQLRIHNPAAGQAEITASSAHDTSVDLAMAHLADPLHNVFAHGFTTDSDNAHALWHHDAAPAPLDFDFIDAIV